VTGKSPLEAYHDQIEEWVRQGKSARWIAETLRVAPYGQSTSYVAVAAYVKRSMQPALTKLRAALQPVDAESVLRWLRQVEASEELTPGQRDKFKLLFEGFDRVAKLRGLYPREGPQVAVAVQFVAADQAAAEVRAMRAILDALPEGIKKEVEAWAAAGRA